MAEGTRGKRAQKRASKARKSARRPTDDLEDAESPVLACEGEATLASSSPTSQNPCEQPADCATSTDGSGLAKASSAPKNAAVTQPGDLGGLTSNIQSAALPDLPGFRPPVLLHAGDQWMIEARGAQIFGRLDWTDVALRGPRNLTKGTMHALAARCLSRGFGFGGWSHLQHGLALECGDRVEVYCDDHSCLKLYLADLPGFEFFISGPREVRSDVDVEQGDPFGFGDPIGLSGLGLSGPLRHERLADYRPKTIAALSRLILDSLRDGLVCLRARPFNRSTTPLEDVWPEQLRSGFALDFTTGELVLNGAGVFYMTQIRVSEDLFNNIDLSNLPKVADDSELEQEAAAVAPRVESTQAADDLEVARLRGISSGALSKPSTRIAMILLLPDVAEKFPSSLYPTTDIAALLRRIETIRKSDRRLWGAEEFTRDTLARVINRKPPGPSRKAKRDVA